MRLFKAIAGRIWAVWGLILFVSTMLLFMIPFLIYAYPASDPKKTFRFISLSRIWMGIFLPLVGCPLRVKGKENFAEGENYVVVCNHNSLMDVPISSPAIPGGNKTIAKVEMAKTPIFGLLYRTGSVLVNRKSETSRKESYLQMRRVLEMGLHMCIYPEGTRNKTDQPLKSFHNGAFKLAIESNKAIVPGIIFNTRKAVPSDKFFYLWPHRLEIHFLAPIPIIKDESVEMLKERTYKIMEDYYISNNRK